MAKAKRNAPKAAATAKGANAAGVETNEATADYHVSPPACNEPNIIFEHKYRGLWWRVQVVDHAGSRYFNVRAWRCGPHGTMLPTKAGFVMPEDRVANLIAALAQATS